MIISVKGLKVTFKTGMFKKEIKALNGLDINVEKGDIFGLIGPNGAGKSTAMYCLLGLIKPDSGSITVFDREPEPGSKLYEKIAYLPEEPHYHLYLTVEEAVRYYGSLYYEDIPDSKIDEVIRKVKLAEFRDLRISKCSKGMKQKVGIAVCLLKDVELLFLDEPTRGLDPMAVKEFRDILLGMNRKGTTIVINSHMLSEIEMICNRVAIMDRGKIVAHDKLENLVKSDKESYYVELEVSEGIPGYMNVTEKTEDRVKGEVPADRIKEFLRFVDEKGLKIYNCSIKKVSLEETFIDILKDKQ